MWHSGRKDVLIGPYGNSLPHNFAKSILQLEEEISSSCTVSKIQTLIQLYSSAVEYYESIKDIKFKHYQDRIHDLLMKEEVAKMLQNESGTPRIPDKNSSSRKLKKASPYKATTARDRVHELKATKLVDEHFSQSSNVYKKLSANIQDQYLALGNRMLIRKKTIQQPSSNQDYVKEVEKIVEKYLKKKKQTKVFLKKKFAGAGNKADYRKELDIELAILEDKKNQELKCIKNNFC